MTMGLIGGVGLLTACAVTWAVVVGAARGDVARNAAAGIRTSATMRSDAAWRAGHEAVVRPMRTLVLVCSLLALLMGAVSAVQGTADPSAVVVVLFAVSYTVFLVGTLLVTRTANRAARAADHDGPTPPTDPA